jgi:hypothetical protein
MKKLCKLFFILLIFNYTLHAQQNEKEIFVEGSDISLTKYIKFCDETVSIPNLYVQKYEVTRKEFEDFMNSYYGNNLLKNYSKDGGLYTYYSMMPYSDCAAVLVTFYEACQYCNWRSVKDGFEPVYVFEDELSFSIEYSSYIQIGEDWVYNVIKMPEIQYKEKANGYRLPTKNEYFYLLLGGKEGIIKKWWNNILLSDYEDTDLHSIKRVGSYKSNPLGLYDLLSNASEWIWGDISEYSRDDNVNYSKYSIGYTIPLEDVKDFELLEYLNKKKKLSSSRPLKRWYIGMRMVRNAE